VLAVDTFTVDTVLLKRLYVLVVIEVACGVRKGHSCSSPVFVEQTAEQIASTNPCAADPRRQPPAQ
jgi:hypothetical protein